jgi:hypothetical protein
MSLDLNERDKYANAYQTNLNYLDNMTSLQVKLLQEGMGGHEKFIYTGLGYVPYTLPSKTYAKDSVKESILDLNYGIKEL